MVAKKTRIGTIGVKMARVKLSITVSPETYEFLQHMVNSGKASTIAEAVDRSIARVHRLENRKRLALATAQYFEQTEPTVMVEENTLGGEMAAMVGDSNFD